MTVSDFPIASPAAPVETAIPRWFGWENSTYSRTAYNVRRHHEDPAHTQTWGIEAALNATFEVFVANSGETNASVTEFGLSYADMTSARVLLDPPPDRDLPIAARTRAWTRWWLRLLFVHLPIRVAVLPFDLPHHDLHHSHALDLMQARHESEATN